MREKDFIKDFYMFLDKIKNKEHFALSRFSDGELYTLQGKRLKLQDDEVIVNNISQRPDRPFPDADKKDFDPAIHKEVQDYLIESFTYKSEEYYKGISCKCCVGQENFDWQINLHGGDDDSLTWSNIFINSNFPRFIEEMVPLFNQYNIVFICNEHANLDNTGLNIIKDFRITKNALVLCCPVIDDISQWIYENNIKDHLFLFAASSLSNIAIHKLYKMYKENTYLDIGSAMNKYIKMDINRNYLEGFYNNGSAMLNKTCIW